MFLAVAIQCLETAFGVTLEDSNLALTQTLPEIFEAAAGKVSCGAAPITAENSENSMGSQWLRSMSLLVREVGHLHYGHWAWFLSLRAQRPLTGRKAQGAEFGGGGQQDCQLFSLGPGDATEPEES